MLALTILAVYLLLIGSMFFILDSRRRTRDAQHFFECFRDVYDLEEVTAGALAVFIEKLRKQRILPPIRLLLFQNKPLPYFSLLGFNPLSVLRLPIAHYPLGIPRKISQGRFPVMIPKTWLEQLDEQDLQWIICHESGHIVNSWKERLIDIWYLLGRPSQYLSNEHLIAREMRADAFAVACTSLEQSTAALRKIGLFSEDFSSALGFNIEVFRRLAELKNRFPP